jgi:hypothetical protein
MRKSWRDEWRAAVLKDPRISNACRVLMLVLADMMRGDGYICRSRSELARVLGVHPSRITQRLNEAVDAGILARIVEGKPGRLAVYQAMRPDGACIRTKRSRNGEYLDMVRRTGPSDGARVRTTRGSTAERGHGACVQSAISTEPQQSDVKAADAKAASAAGHPLPPVQSGFSSRSTRSGEPPKAGLSSTAGDEYEAARRLLDRLDRSDRNQCRARAVAALGFDAGEKTLAVYAADIARAEIGDVA